MAAAVVLGAFGAHALKGRLTPDMAAVFETGVRYHITHALALLAVGLVAVARPQTPVFWAGWAFITGIVVFSGSLYVLSLTGVRGWGAVTPIGGLAFLIGWALLAHAAFRS